MNTALMIKVESKRNEKVRPVQAIACWTMKTSEEHFSFHLFHAWNSEQSITKSLNMSRHHYLPKSLWSACETEGTHLQIGKDCYSITSFKRMFQDDELLCSRLEWLYSVPRTVWKCFRIQWRSIYWAECL